MIKKNNIKRTTLLIFAILGVSIFSSNSMSANAAVNSVPMGMITSDNVAYGKNAGLTDPFIRQSGEVKFITIEGSRVGIITNDDVAYVKNSFESTTWERQTGECKKIVLDGNKVGLLMKDGRAYVKEGFSYETQGVYQGNDIADMVIDGNRVGIIKNDKKTYVKDDITSQNWTMLSDGWIKQLVIENNNTGFITYDNVATVNGIRQTGDAKQLELDGGRVGVVLNNGISYWKDGVSTTAWNTIKSDTKEISLYSNNIIVLLNNGQAFTNNVLQSSYAIKIAGAELPVSNITVPPTLTEQEKIINEANYWVGKIPYYMDSLVTTQYLNRNNPPKYMDCADFTSSVYLTVTNRNIGTWTGTQKEAGRAIDISAAKSGNYSGLIPGDLIIFTWPGGSYTYGDHVGIYMGNGKIIHESGTNSTGGNVRIDYLDTNWGSSYGGQIRNSIISIRRIL